MVLIVQLSTGSQLVIILRLVVGKETTIVLEDRVDVQVGIVRVVDCPAIVEDTEALARLPRRVPLATY